MQDTEKKTESFIKKNYFHCFLKDSSESAKRSWSWRLFQSLGAKDGLPGLFYLLVICTCQLHHLLFDFLFSEFYLKFLIHSHINHGNV